VTVTGQDDDILQGLVQTDRVYRYPILGTPLTNPGGSLAYPIYEVVIPGPVVPVNGFGRV
jgi:hypothetical protein